MTTGKGAFVGRRRFLDRAARIAVAVALGADCATLARGDVGAAATLDPLEDAFFDLLWRCGAPRPREVEAAKRELAERFVEFEPIWTRRSFLTDGQISEQARRIFEEVEEERRAALFARASTEFVARLRVEPTSDDETRRAIATLALPTASRVVWLAPDVSRMLLRDAGRLWRPRAPFASQEIAPEREDAELEIETLLEPTLEFDESAPIGDRSFSCAALVGLDLRPLAIPLVVNGRVDAKRGALRSGELTLREPTIAFDERRARLRVALRFDYDAAFDAFDSFRAWFDRDDFELELGAEEERRALRPTRLFARGRSVSGSNVELDFSLASALDASPRVGRASLRLLLPRFFQMLTLSSADATSF